jgi:hypothetical protein
MTCPYARPFGHSQDVYLPLCTGAAPEHAARRAPAAPGQGEGEAAAGARRRGAGARDGDGTATAAAGARRRGAKAEGQGRRSAAAEGEGPRGGTAEAAGGPLPPTSPRRRLPLRAPSTAFSATARAPLRCVPTPRGTCAGGRRSCRAGEPTAPFLLPLCLSLLSNLAARSILRLLSPLAFLWLCTTCRWRCRSAPRPARRARGPIRR